MIEVDLVFEPDGQRVRVLPGTRLLAAVRRAGRPIGFSCRGRGVCLACRLRCTGALDAPGPRERALLAKIDDEGAWRIACLARVTGPATVRADYW